MSGSPGARPTPKGQRQGDHGQAKEGGTRGSRGFDEACRELELLLGELDRDFWKHGLLTRTEMRPVGAESSDETAASDSGARYRAGSLAGALALGLRARLRQVVDACAALSREERCHLAGLLRLPEARRRTVASLLRLSEPHRRALAAVLGLSDEECAGLAEFLLPRTQQPPEPTLTIVDPALVQADEPGAVGPGAPPSL